jgi:nucleotide-binding universal stress UspA family protein
MAAAAPALSRVLCATDLSEFGDRAVPFAFALAAPGGRVTLLHVLHAPALPSPLVPRYGEKRASPAELEAQERELRERLDALGAPLAKAHGLGFEAQVVRAARIPEAIVAEAERLDADAICLSTHARAGLAELVLGSAADHVLHHAHRPVLLIPAPLEG